MDGRRAVALLVGDVNEIPLSMAATGSPADDLYASTNGDDPDEEIFLGRLSVSQQCLSKLFDFHETHGARKRAAEV